MLYRRQNIYRLPGLTSGLIGVVFPYWVWFVSLPLNTKYSAVCSFSGTSCVLIHVIRRTTSMPMLDPDLRTVIYFKLALGFLSLPE